MADKYLPTQYQQYIHLSRYSRWDYDKQRRETWKETVDRYGDFCIQENEHFGAKHPVYLTHKITVTFHRPAMLEQPAVLVAECLSFGEEEGVYRSLLHSGGKLAADAEVRWRRFQIRR